MEMLSFADNIISHLLLSVVMPTVSTDYHIARCIEVHVPIPIIHWITIVAVGSTPPINSAASEIKSSVLMFIMMVASDSSKKIVVFAAEIHGSIPIINIASIVTVGVKITP